MQSKLHVMIKNYVHRFYINSILNNKDLNKVNSSNVMITSYFRKNMFHIKSSSNAERKKFFFSFRKKNIEVFKRYRKYYTTVISNFRQRKAFKEFKSNFSTQEWEKINGERLSKYLALLDGTIKKSDFNHYLNIIKIIDKK